MHLTYTGCFVYDKSNFLRFLQQVYSTNAAGTVFETTCGKQFNLKLYMIRRAGRIAKSDN